MKHISIIITFLLIASVTVGIFWWQAEEPTVASISSPKVANSPPKTPAVINSTANTISKEKLAPTDKVVKPIKLRFFPENGVTLAYSFASEAEAQVDLGFLYTQALQAMQSSTQASNQQPKTNITFKSTGELYLKYYAYKPGRWNVAAKIGELDYQINGQTPAYIEAIQHPFAFRMNTSGYLSHFQFTNGIPTEAQKFIQSILYAMQVGFAKEAKTSWRTREVDSTGAYRAEYTLTAIEPTIRLNKRKLEYLATEAAQSDLSSMMASAITQVEHSQHQIVIPQKGTWLLSVKQEEQIVSTAGGHEWSNGSSRFSVNRALKDLSQQFPDRFAQFRADLNAQHYIKSKYYATHEQLNLIGADLDINGALATYEEIKNSGTMNAKLNAEKFFVNYLRQYPQTVFQLVELMNNDPNNNQFDHSTHLTLWYLITKAGHTEAQQAVMQAATDPSFSSLSHTRALLYIHDFENPERFVAEQLWALYQDLQATEKTQQQLSMNIPAIDIQTTQELKNMSIYAFGALGHQDKLNNELKSNIGQQLVAHLQNSTEPKEQMLTLEAIGNYGGAEVLNDINPYFTIEEPSVRASAYDALRRMDDPAAIAMLAKHYATEQNPITQQAALQTLTQMPPTKEGIEWARKQALVVNFDEGQEALAKVLGENLKEYPENEIVLREMLKLDLSNQVKQKIYSYVAPK